MALRLIEALQRSGQAQAAENVVLLFVRQNPRNVAGQILYASLMMQSRDWQSAIRIYESLRGRLGDNEATILNNLAWAYSETGDYEAAIPLARRAWALDRDNPATADTLGWILFKSGDDVAGVSPCSSSAATRRAERCGDPPAIAADAGELAQLGLVQIQLRRAGSQSHWHGRGAADRRMKRPRRR